MNKRPLPVTIVSWSIWRPASARSRSTQWSSRRHVRLNGTCLGLPYRAAGDCGLERSCFEAGTGRAGSRFSGSPATSCSVCFIRFPQLIVHAALFAVIKTFLFLPRSSAYFRGAACNWCKGKSGILPTAVTALCECHPRIPRRPAVLTTSVAQCKIYTEIPRHLSRRN